MSDEHKSELENELEAELGGDFGAAFGSAGGVDGDLAENEFDKAQRSIDSSYVAAGDIKRKRIMLGAGVFLVLFLIIDFFIGSSQDSAPSSNAKSETASSVTTSTNSYSNNSSRASDESIADPSGNSLVAFGNESDVAQRSSSSSSDVLLRDYDERESKDEDVFDALDDRLAKISDAKMYGADNAEASSSDLSTSSVSIASQTFATKEYSNLAMIRSPKSSSNPYRFEFPEEVELLGKGAEIEDRLRAQILKDEGIELSHTQLVERLVRSLKLSNDEKYTLEIGVILRRIANVQDTDSLITFLNDKGFNSSARSFIVEAIGRSRDLRAFDALRFELEQGRPEILPAIIEAFGRLGDEKAIPLLLRVVNSDDNSAYARDLKIKAVTALAWIGTTRSREAIKDHIITKDKAIITAAKWGLAYMDQKVMPQRISTEIPAGRKRLILSYKGTESFFYRPTKQQNAMYPSRLLVCIHDIDLDARRVFDACRAVANDLPIGVLAPIFDNVRFPEFETFSVRSMRGRTDVRLREILELVKEYGDADIRELYFIGFGKGGRFVQNFVLAYPDNVSRAIIFSPDKLTIPDEDRLFPNGIGQTPFALDLNLDLKRFVKSNLLLCLSNELRTSRAVEKLEKFVAKQGITRRYTFSEFQANKSEEIGDKSPLIKNMRQYLFETVN